MAFNSVDFAIFLPVVFGLYWFATRNSLKLQNLLIVIASCIFYGWWDPRFLLLLVFSSVVDFGLGLALKGQEGKRARSLLMVTSLIVNLGLLGLFKYYNFFVDTFASTFLFFGSKFSVDRLEIVLPLGISFYTFQTLSYTIDVYRKKLEPTSDFIAFFAFVSFFPQLVAGPIERATNLLPQFYRKRNFDYGNAIDGIRQILWGLFKKIVIADNCAEYANMVFNNSAGQPGSSLLLASMFFAFQIYGDFSGYSDIAIGTSRLFGFSLTRNFAFPYFSRDIGEFWRRWHISLSSWFRDYLYIPLGGSRGGTWLKVRNTFIIFGVSGLWHGANWTFVIWGLLHAAYFLPLLVLNKNRNNIDIVAKGRLLPTLQDFFSILFTFVLTVFAWIFFRAENVAHAFQILNEIFSISIFAKVSVNPIEIIFLIFLFLLIEWFGREDQYAIEMIFVKKSKLVNWCGAFLIILTIFIFGNFSSKYEFIYFQF